VRTRIAVDAVEGSMEVVGQGVSGGEDVVASLDLDGVVVAGGVVIFLLDQPVRFWSGGRRQGWSAP
jgi:hypothetical protein